MRATEPTDRLPEEGVNRTDEDATPLLSLDDDGMAVLASNDEWAFRKADRLVAKLPDKRRDTDRKTEGEVFDKQTLLVLHKLLVHGVLKSLDFPVATGKEANVFRGTTPRGGYVAVKIYRTNTATFKHVLQYIQGDERFQGVTGDKRSLVQAWCQKEHRNLLRMQDAGVSVPEPIRAIQNVLVTEYIGLKEGPFPQLKAATPLQDADRLYGRVVEDYVLAYNNADLVHADLSEYNILLENAHLDPSQHRPRIIDVGQAVLKDHPMAREFLDRDLRNITQFFRRQGVDDARADDIKVRLDPRRQKRKDDEFHGQDGDEE